MLLEVGPASGSSYGPVEAVRGIDLAVAPGEMVALLGAQWGRQESSTLQCHRRPGAGRDRGVASSLPIRTSINGVGDRAAGAPRADPRPRKGRRVFGLLERRGELELGRLQSCRAPARGAFGRKPGAGLSALFPILERTAPSAGWHPLGRPAAAVGHRPGPHVGAPAPACCSTSPPSAWHRSIVETIFEHIAALLQRERRHHPAGRAERRHGPGDRRPRLRHRQRAYRQRQGTAAELTLLQPGRSRLTSGHGAERLRRPWSSSSSRP